MYSKRFPLLLLLLFLLSFLYFYPSLLLITDEQSYFNLALSLLSDQPGIFLHQEFISNYKINIIEAEYAIGTPFLLSLIIGLLGNSAVFILPILCFAISFFLVYKIQCYLGYDVYGTLIFFLYLPLLFLCRTVMSEMPSLLLLSIALYILVRNQENQKFFWLIFFLGGLSVLLRETNALIFAPLLLYTFFNIQNRKKIIGFIVFLLGLSNRLIANYWVYGDAFHLKHGYPFSISYLPNNLVLYLVILSLVIPAGIFLIYKYKGHFKNLLFSIIILFTSVHLFYGYDATDYSGYKMGLILNGRFYIPLLPIFAIYLGYYISELQPNIKKWFKIIIGIGALISGLGSQYYLSKITDNHRQIADTISTYQDQVLIFDHTLHSNIGRYINPFLENINKTIDLSRISNQDNVNQLFSKTNKAYIIQSERNETKDKVERNIDINNLVDSTLFNMQIDTTLYTGDGGQITITQISPK